MRHFFNFLDYAMKGSQTDWHDFLSLNLCITHWYNLWADPTESLNFNVHGAQIKNAKCLKHYQNFNTNAILTCNTAMEQEFYGLSRDVFKNYEIFPIKHKFEYFLQLPELADAHLGFNFKFWGCLRSVWPPKSHISWFSFKYHIEMIFFHIKPFRGYFAIDLILLKKQEIPNNGL